MLVRAGKRLAASVGTHGTLGRGAGRHVPASVAATGTMGRGSSHHLTGAAAVSARIGHAVGKVFRKTVGVIGMAKRVTTHRFLHQVLSRSIMKKDSPRAFAATTVPQGRMSPNIGVRFRAAVDALGDMLARFFEFPSDCNTITAQTQDRLVLAASQDRIIVLDTCDPKTYAFPARYTAESMLYGVDFSHRLDPGESIVTAVAEVSQGDLTVSAVDTDGTTITFRLTGGTVAYQRLNVRGVTDATPPNTIQVEATIACYP